MKSLQGLPRLISASVGAPGKARNLPADVQCIQYLFNLIIPKMGFPLAENGKSDGQLVQCISQYQFRHLKYAHPDGVVDPTGRTFNSLIEEAVKVPVIAAGGIADAQGVAAAMALGAAGAQVGTAYLLCPEATTSAVHRAALQSPAAGHTALTTLFSGRPARGIVNRVMRELGPLTAPTPEFPLATTAIAPLRAKAESQGRGDFSPLWSGQNASGCKAIGAAALTLELAGRSSLL